MRLSSVCVFAGAMMGVHDSYRQAAAALGSELARREVTLVYGGASVGLMGAVADAALRGGGRVVGVIPHAIVEREVAHLGLSELRIVDSMHARKALMGELSDAFLALPGGLGTLDELFEVATWRQLGLHAKPLGLLNVRGYYDPLIAALDHAAAQGFLKAEHRQILLVDTDVDALLERLGERAGSLSMMVAGDAHAGESDGAQARTQIADSLVCVVEIPKGGRNKYEYDERLGGIKFDRLLQTAATYPTDYGYLRDTLGLDGDPLDALVCLTEPTFSGCLIPVKPVALFKMQDEKGIDDKIICVPLHDPYWNRHEQLQDLPALLRDEIEQFFSIYKDLEGKQVTVEGWRSLEDAKIEIAAAQERYRAQPAERGIATPT